MSTLAGEFLICLENNQPSTPLYGSKSALRAQAQVDEAFIDEFCSTYRLFMIGPDELNSQLFGLICPCLAGSLSAPRPVLGAASGNENGDVDGTRSCDQTNWCNFPCCYSCWGCQELSDYPSYRIWCQNPCCLDQSGPRGSDLHLGPDRADDIHDVCVYTDSEPQSCVHPCEKSNGTETSPRLSLTGLVACLARWVGLAFDVDFHTCPQNLVSLDRIVELLVRLQSKSWKELAETTKVEGETVTDEAEVEVGCIAGGGWTRLLLSEKDGQEQESQTRNGFHSPGQLLWLLLTACNLGARKRHLPSCSRTSEPKCLHVSPAASVNRSSYDSIPSSPSTGLYQSPDSILDWSEACQAHRHLSRTSKGSEYYLATAIDDDSNYMRSALHRVRSQTSCYARSCTSSGIQVDNSGIFTRGQLGFKYQSSFQSEYTSSTPFTRKNRMSTVSMPSAVIATQQPPKRVSSSTQPQSASGVPWTLGHSLATSSEASNWSINLPDYGMRLQVAFDIAAAVMPVEFYRRDKQNRVSNGARQMGDFGLRHSTLNRGVYIMKVSCYEIQTDI
ncbi:unnamed protein product [Protopolystoma xenopodis]|uniref:Uncharacterized protein n=1 Tax=Protopolystoma xenopodis TaxID=117903 RepID=A0A448WCL8_9PLAT|nr:unnamed protein product [Protopolystoma xenopodis]